MLPKPIPDKLLRTVQPQWVPCGKPKCKCVSRGQLHGPFHYRFWRDENGRQHKEYVRKTDVEAVKAACDAMHAQELETLELLAKGREVLRWGQGKQLKSENPIEELEQLVEMQTTVRLLVLLASGDFGTASQQVRAASLLFEIKEARRGSDTRSQTAPTGSLRARRCSDAWDQPSRRYTVPARAPCRHFTGFCPLPTDRARIRPHQRVMPRDSHCVRARGYFRHRNILRIPKDTEHEDVCYS